MAETTVEKMGARLPRALAAAGLGLLLASCSGFSRKFERVQDFETRVGQAYRVAVLPFTFSAPMDSALTSGLGGLGSVLALEGLTDEAPPQRIAATTLRRAFVASLAGSRFEVSALWLTDTNLRHNGLLASTRRTTNDARKIAALLDVDGVIVGDVIAWNRSYYGLQSSQEVGLQLELVDRRSGRRLIKAEYRANDASGLTGGPTGFVSAGTAPIAGLKGSTLAELARDVARAAASDLGAEPDPNEALRVDAARGEVPMLAFFSFHTSRAGALRPGDRITVAAVGTADCECRFDLGRYRSGIPMVATDRYENVRGTRQTYVGHYVVQPGDTAAQLPVSVTISRGGRSSRHRVTRATVRLTSS